MHSDKMKQALAPAPASFPGFCNWHTARVNQLKWSMCLHDGHKDGRISQSIMRTGCWECSTVQGMLTLLKSHHNSTLIDIGANIGYFSLAAAVSGAAHHVYAFEASPKNSVLFEESVSRSALDIPGKITLFTVALGAAPGMVRIGTSRRNQGGLHHVEANPKHGGTQVARVTLDSVLAPANGPVFVKMDVEGAECAVVRGMHNFLRESVPIIGFVVEISQSRGCCDEWCSEEGLFGHLHARSLCPWSAGSNSRPKREPLRLSNCRRWCGGGAEVTGDVVWLPCVVRAA